MQHNIRLPYGPTSLESEARSEEEANAMGLTRPINALVICAAFAFIGALIIGVLP